MYRWLLSVFHSIFGGPGGGPEPEAKPEAKPLLKRRLSDSTPATDEIEAKRPRLGCLIHRVKKSIWDITKFFGTPANLSQRCPEDSGCNGSHTGSPPEEVFPERSSPKLTKSEPWRDVLTSGKKARNGASKHSDEVSRHHPREVMPSFSFPRNQEVCNKRMSGRHYVKSPPDSSLAWKQPVQDRNLSEGPPAETSRALRRARCTVEEASPRDHFGSLFASIGAARTPSAGRVFRERRERSIKGCCNNLKKDAMETVSLLSLQTITDKVTESWGPVRVMRSEKRHTKAKIPEPEKTVEHGSENESTMVQQPEQTVQQPEPRSVQQPEPRSVQQPEPRSVQQPEQRSVQQPEQRSVPQPEQRSVPQPEQRRVPQPEQRSVQQPEQWSVQQPEQWSVQQPEQWRVPQPEQRSVQQPEQWRVPQPEQRSVQQPEQWRVPQPEQRSVPQPEQWSVPQPEQWSVPQPEQWSVQQPEQWSVPQPEQWSVPQPEQWSVPQPEQRSVQQPEQRRAQQPEQRRVQQPEQRRAPQPEQRRAQQPEQRRAPQPEQRRAQQPEQRRVPQPEQRRVQQPEQRRVQQPEQRRVQQPEPDLSEEVSSRLHLGNGNTTVFKRRHSGPEMKEQQDSGQEKEKAPEELPELTEDMEKEINSALGCGSQDEVLSSAFKLRITRGDIQTLRNCHWLNDEIINFYMNLLVERNKKQGLPTLHAFSTFFYPKLNVGGYQSVKRWTKGVDLFEQDLVLMPIHRRAHWSLVVIDMRKKTIKYLDSMGQKGHRICNLMLRYLQEESKTKRNRELNPAEWSLESVKAYEIPQQSNGSDCGMFTCKYADYLSQDKPITFTQNQMAYFRRRMVWEILHQQLL